MKTNAQATIYNKSIDLATRSEVYQRTVIAEVYWENRRAVNKLSSGGDLAADKVLVLIPMTLGENHLAPLAWQALEDKSSSWTLQTGDLIVRGAILDEITGEFTVSDLKRQYDDVLAIQSVDRMDTGSARVRHWQVGAA
jgi:hypothetical protein